MCPQNSTDNSQLGSICSPDNLEFRAACNQVLAASSPLNRRIITRICQSADAQLLFAQVWTGAGGSKMPTGEFFQRLVTEPAWRTLVLEEVEKARQWSDLIRAFSIKDIFNWFGSLIEKLLDKEHPTARKATITATTLIALWAGHAANKDLYRQITLPIRAIFTGDEPSVPITVNLSKDKIPVTLSPEVDGKVPFVLSLSPEASELKLHVVGDGTPKSNPTDAVNSVATELRQSNRSLNDAVSDLALMAKCTTKIDTGTLDKTLQTISKNLEDTSSHLNDVQQKIGDLTTKYDQKTIDESKATATRNQSVDHELELLTRASASRSGPIFVTLGQNTSQSVPLPFFDPASGQSSVAVVKITVGKITSTRKGKQAILSINTQPTANEANPDESKPVEEGYVKPVLIQNHTWILTVNSIQSHRVGKSVVQLSLAQEVTLSPEPGQTVAKSGAP